MRIIKIGGHFDAPHPKQFSKERVGALDVAANSCDVVQALAEGHVAGNFAYGFGPGLSLNTGFVTVVDKHFRGRFAKLSAEGLGGLVNSPAWTAGGNFEDAAIGVIEVD